MPSLGHIRSWLFKNSTFASIFGGASPVTLIIDYSSTQFVFKFKLPSTKTVTLDWGDGTTEDVVGQDATLITKTSNYSTAGTYTFSVGGDVYDITWVDTALQRFVSGSIDGWGDLIQLVKIQLILSSMYGNVSSLSPLTALETLNITDTPISGSLPEAVKLLPNIEYIYCRDSQVSGDVSELAGVSSLLQLYSWGTFVTFDNIALWDMTGEIRLEDNNFTSAMVDNALQSFVNLTGCTIDLSGNNAPRTSASDAAFAIVDANNTLTVN